MQTGQAFEETHPNRQGADDDSLLTSAQVRARTGNVTNMCLWRWQRDKRVMFPAPDVVINNRRYWRAGTIRRWQAERTTNRAA